MTTNEQEWERARHGHPVFGERGGKDFSSFWNDSADSYDWSGYSEIARQMVADLRDMGVFADDAEVIDIGCGPGAFTRLIAPLVKSVHCTDISGEMISRLKREMDSLGISNYSSEVCDCTAMPEDRRKDVAFASLCPQFNSPEGIVSLEKYAGKKCVYISSANTETTMESEIWHMLGCDYSYGGYDTKYPFEHLREKGREPFLKFYTQPRIVDESEDGCIARYERMFSRYRELTDDVKAAIGKVVRSHSSDERVHTERTMRMGLLVWTPVHS